MPNDHSHSDAPAPNHEGAKQSVTKEDILRLYYNELAESIKQPMYKPLGLTVRDFDWIFEDRQAERLARVLTRLFMLDVEESIKSSILTVAIIALAIDIKEEREEATEGGQHT